MTRRTSSRRLPLIAWNSALCSESTGSTVAPDRRRAPHEQGAGADQAFLVGERDDRAALGRRQRRLEPGRAGDRADHPFGRASRRLDERAFAGAGLDARSGERVLEFADRPAGSPTAAKRAPSLARKRGKRGGILVGA